MNILTYNPHIDIYIDSANIEEIEELLRNPVVKGITTNPTLMKKAGINNYEEFAKSLIQKVPNLPISFEVIADDFNEMYRQAQKISSWGDNVYVKIPIINTKGVSSIDLIKKLNEKNIKVNVTAIFYVFQLLEAINVLNRSEGILSIFAGRITDTGKPANWIFEQAIKNKKPNQKILWASTRRLYDIIDAEILGVDIITVTPDLLKKISTIGKSLEDMCLDTVKMFYNDAISSGLTL